MLHRRAELMYLPERRQDALVACRDLAALEEALDGTTSEVYVRGIDVLASAMEKGGDSAGALPLYRKAVDTADAGYAAYYAWRSTLRANAAMAYARVGQFDEAEQLAREAVAIGEHLPPPQPNMFAGQLQQILSMKQAASAPKQ